FRTMYAAYAEQMGKTRFGDKTPNYVLNIPALAEMFPESRFVHVIRDGRDVALAIRDMTWGPSEIRDIGPYWAERVRAGRAAGRELGTGRYLEVAYEKLNTETEASLNEIANFLDLPYSRSMLDNSNAVERQIAMSPLPVEDQSLLRPIGSISRRWQEQMEDEDLRGFEDSAGDLLLELGYPLASASRFRA
ncbi:MAG: sulfotransferase family protein, partial [Sulfobacillus sp.]